MSEDDVLVLDKKAVLKHSLMWVVLITFSILYYFIRPIWDGFYLYMKYVYEYITLNIDLLILFYGLIVLPLIGYFIWCICAIIRTIWVSYTPLKIRIYFVFAKHVICVFSVILLIIKLLSRAVITTQIWWLIVAGCLTIMVFIFFIDFSDVAEGDFRTTAWDLIRNLITAIAFAVVLSLYYLSPLNSNIDGLITTINGDIAFAVFFWALILLEFIGPILLAFARWVAYKLEAYREKLVWWAKIAVFILWLYFIAKMAIFMIASYVEEPYPTFLSMGISIGSGLLTRNANRILAWTARKKD